MNKPKEQITVKDFFAQSNAEIIKFGRLFTANLANEELINELARKDLEKLAKVFKLVFELMEENTRGDSDDKIAELIAAFAQAGEEDEA